VDSFKKFFGTDTRRHMRPLSRVTKKHPGRFVPKVHQTKFENKKYQNVKLGTSRYEVLNQRDFKELRKAGFKFAPSCKIPVKLGNTGIKIVFKPEIGKFILTK
jgi:hypothetical protein